MDCPFIRARVSGRERDIVSLARRPWYAKGMLKIFLGVVLLALPLAIAACGSSNTKAADVNNALSAPEHVNESTEPQGPAGGNKTVAPGSSAAPSPK
jgi:hypothetical protein